MTKPKDTSIVDSQIKIVARKKWFHNTQILSVVVLCSVYVLFMMLFVIEGGVYRLKSLTQWELTMFFLSGSTAVPIVLFIRAIYEGKDRKSTRLNSSHRT